MREWRRVIVPTLCGGCNRTLAKGDPVEVREFAYLGGRPTRRFRCDRCAGPAPPDLPAFIERAEVVTMKPFSKLVPTRSVAPVLVDYRMRAAGDREPGEEG